MTPDEARAALEKRGVSRTGAPLRSNANSQGSNPLGESTPADLMEALKAIPQDEASVAERKAKLADKKARSESIQMPRDGNELIEYVRAAGRGHFMGDDTFDNIGSGIATAMALPGAIGKLRTEDPEMSILDAGLQASPEIFRDIKGTVDMQEQEFEEENPYAADKLGYVGDVAQAYGALRGGLPLAKSAAGSVLRPTVGAAWKGLKKEIIDDVGGLAQSLGRFRK